MYVFFVGPWWYRKSMTFNLHVLSSCMNLVPPAAPAKSRSSNRKRVTDEQWPGIRRAEYVTGRCTPSENSISLSPLIIGTKDR